MLTWDRCLLADSWRGIAPAISFQLRGPLTVIDNAFTNGSNKVWKRPAGDSKPCQAYKCAADKKEEPCWVTPCSVPMDYAPWAQTNGLALFAGNTIDAAAVTSAELLPKPAKNVQVHDLVAPPGSATTKSPLTSETRFLKSWWPYIPTALVDARAHGCTGNTSTVADSTSCAQATIDAAAAAGDGAAAYFGPGVYRISGGGLVVKAGNYTVRGSGFKTIFEWANATVDPSPAVLTVTGGGGGGLRLEQFFVVSSATTKHGTGHAPTVLHDGGGGGSGGGAAGAAGAAGKTTVYDGIYTGTGAGGCSWKNECWNATGMVVKDLQQGDVVHFVHLE